MTESHNIDSTIISSESPDIVSSITTTVYPDFGSSNYNRDSPYIGSWGHGGRVVTLLPPTSEVGGSIPVTALSGKAGSCLPLVGSLQYITLANSMYWFPLPFQLPVVI